MKKTIKEMIEVMRAFDEGKQIQLLCVDGSWRDTNPCWNWSEFNYRIKPEPKEPTYRPYESIDEMVADYERRFQPKPYSQRPMFTMPLIWVRVKASNEIMLYTVFNETKYSFMCGFEYYEYLDGTPFGKLVEE